MMSNNETMQAVWLEDQKLQFRRDVPIPRASEGEALVRVRMAGICATDLEMVRGYYPFEGVLGHEFVGEVVHAPDLPGWVGKRVVGEINVACGDCQSCRAGLPSHCEQRNVLGIIDRHGSFAEYLTLPVENLHLVPDSVSDRAAVFTEPLAAALEIQQQVHIRPDDSVLLIGAGRLGMLIAQTLALSGANLQVVVRHEYQRQMLQERRIATTTEDKILENSVDIVIEATGSEDGFRLARKAVRPCGSIVMKSTYKGEVQVNFSSLVVDEITLVGSRCGPFSPAVRLLDSGLVDPLPLIHSEYPLSDALPAFEKAASPGVLKVLLVPPASE